MTGVSAVATILTHGQPVVDASDLFIAENRSSQVQHAHRALGHWFGAVRARDWLED